MDIAITYAVTACIEHVELDKLLPVLKKHKRDQDEILVQVDSDSVTKEVSDVIAKHGIKEHKFPLNQDFASFKNNLKKISKGYYIFQIDADEIPSIEIINNLPSIIQAHPSADLFLVPRVNIVEGITEDHIKKWNWKQNSNGWINWPDYQYRIFKNNFNIKWQNKVHEYISGTQNILKLPDKKEYALQHTKSISKQESQNKLYEKIV